MFWRHWGGVCGSSLKTLYIWQSLDQLHISINGLNQFFCKQVYAKQQLYLWEGGPPVQSWSWRWSSGPQNDPFAYSAILEDAWSPWRLPLDSGGGEMIHICYDPNNKRRLDLIAQHFRWFYLVKCVLSVYIMKTHTCHWTVGSCVFYLVVEDAHAVQRVEVLLQQGSSSRIKIDLVQLQHRHCHPEQSFVHWRLLETHIQGPGVKNLLLIHLVKDKCE